VDPYTDDELLTLLRSGDRKAFLYLYELYKYGLYQYCLRLLRDGSLAEDALQQTFEKVFSKCATVADPSLLRGWIYTIARNEAFGLLRAKSPDECLDDEYVSTDPSVLETLERKETADDVRRAIDMLSPAYREVIVLREYDGASYDEIARITGSTVSAVKSRLFKARSVLMERMKSIV
jgi:RNA polymerase sigma-70 factor, ECF subfamily